MRQYHKNPRKISKAKFARLEDTLRRLGDLSGIVHDLVSDEIIGGNQRGRVFDIDKCDVVLVDGPREPDEQGTVALGYVVWEGKRYAYRQVNWTPAQCEEANITANLGGGEWDFTELANWEAPQLVEWGFDAETLKDWKLNLAGLGELLESEKPPKEDAEPQTDRAEELREKWGVEPGQLWRLPSRTPGQEHRLICGDCTDAAVVERVMQGDKLGSVLTDPPYGMNLDADYSKMPQETVRGKKYLQVIGDDKDFDFTQFDYLDCEEQFWFGADYYCQQLPTGGSWFVWDKRTEKNDAVIGSGFELCWSKTPHKRKILRYLWSGFTARDPGETRTHPTQKPVRMFGELIGGYTDKSEVVLDLFLGSGTTLIAAENLSRQCRAVEISPAYVAVALQRYEDAFGITPELISPIITNG